MYKHDKLNTAKVVVLQVYVFMNIFLKWAHLCQVNSSMFYVTSPHLTRSGEGALHYSNNIQPAHDL